METGSSPDTESSDYAFAFNDANFSDRILLIKILPDSFGYKPDTDDSLLEWARYRKRRRDEQFVGANELAEQVEEQILNFNIPDWEGGVAYENQEEEAVAMIEESRMGAGAGITSNQSVEHEVPRVYETRSSADCQTVQTKTIHISSPILAAQSPFFYKLFSNGMKESEQRQVTLVLNASEEAAFMDMLNFMYSNTLPRNTPTALLQVLMAADKYEVASCMRYCIRLLRNIPMTCEAALLYLHLPSTVLMADTVQPLMDVAKQFLAVSFKDMTKFEDDLLNLPLAGIEAVLSSDNLEIPSEDAIYDFVLKWARQNYPKFEERREILSTVLRYVRFPYMTCMKLKHVLLCGDTDDKLAAKFVIEALFYKTDHRYRQRSFLPDDANASSRRFVARTYTFRPVTVVEFESPRQERIIYFDLKRVECEQLFPTGAICSQAFHLGGQRFILSGHCNRDQQCNCFGLFLGLPQKGSVSLTVEYEFSSRTKPSEAFVVKHKGSCTFTVGRTSVGYRNLFGVPWTAFIADDSPYFINGFLHLRAELTIKR